MLTVLNCWAHLHRHLVIEQKKFNAKHERAIICICFRVTFLPSTSRIASFLFSLQLNEKNFTQSSLRSSRFLLPLSCAHHFFFTTILRFFHQKYNNYNRLLQSVPLNQTELCSLSYSFYFSPLFLFIYLTCTHCSIKPIDPFVSSLICNPSDLPF